MTHEKFTSVTFNDLDPSGTRISRSWVFSVDDSTDPLIQISLNDPWTNQPKITNSGNSS